MAQLTERTSLIASAAAAVGASICCVGPLVLLMLGISGSWIGSLTAIEPFRPYLIGLTLLFLGLAFRRLYLVPQPCAQVQPAPIRQHSGDNASRSGLLQRYCSVSWPCRGSPHYSIERNLMRKLLIATLTFLPLIAFAAPPATVTLDVKNMTCTTCPITVRKSLEKVSGVSAVKVDYDKKTATVTYDPDKATLDALTHATTNAGFPSTVRK